MDVLFCCASNVCRSQVAQALFDGKYAPVHQSESAGVYVDERYRGKRLEELSPAVVSLMAEHGYDVGARVSKQVTPELITRRGIIVMMTDWQTWPECINDYSRTGNLIQWDIPDPRYGTLDDMRAVVSILDEHVASLDVLLSRG